jgi:predicted phosphodiesterase
VADRDDSARQASAVFDGTPLEGARITGRLAGVIDTYGGYVVDAYRDNESFYDGAVTNLETAWAERAASDAELAVLRRSSTLRSPTAPTSPSPTTGADGADEGSEPVVMLVVSDLHCNVGMARVIRSVAEHSGATIVLNAGDTTINGTAVESYCVTAFVGAVPDGAQMVVADGNHDSEQTSAQERAAGVVVLSGEVVDVAGVRILGDSDPNATRIGVGTSLVGEETVVDAGRRLAEVACADRDGVDLLLVHNPNVGNRAQDEGCAPAQVSGHVHRRIGPTAHGEGVRFVSSSTAGAVQGQATLGPLNGVAELTILRFDPDSRSFIDYRLVRVFPDAQVSVGFAVRWPDGVAEPPPRPAGPR